MKFNKYDTVNFQILANLTIKCKVMQVDIDTRKNIITYWLQALEDKTPYKANEYFITDNVEQKLSKMNKDNKWQVAETPAPAIIWFHKKTLMERIFKRKALPQPATPAPKFEKGFQFELLNQTK